MTEQSDNPTGGPRLEAAPAGTRRRDGRVSVTVRLENPDRTRAVHYIADVRAVVVDAGGRLVVRLTDQGRSLIPGALRREPSFARLDPGATALLTVDIPDTVVRMRVGGAPTDEAELERFVVADGQDLDVVIGFSDTPFYADPRSPEARARSTVTWERGQARLTARVGG